MDKIIQSVLITGGTGSFGRNMLRDLLNRGTCEVRILSRNEEKQEALRGEFQDDRVLYFVGDIRDPNAVERAIQGVQCVIHAAALKRVASCESFPQDAVRTNVIGSENVVRAAIRAEVESLICVSTDKAVFPIDAMGMSKALMEKVARAASRELGKGAKTLISCVRCGNVMFSSGSAIPLFVSQIKSRKPITITDPAMTRFLMPPRDGVALVNHACEHANQGDLFIRKLPATTIFNLVQAIKELFDVPDHPTITIGRGYAEKIFETLASAQELGKAEDLGDYYRLELDSHDLDSSPSFRQEKPQMSLPEDYHSRNAEQLSVQDLKNLLSSLAEVQAELATWSASKYSAL